MMRALINFLTGQGPKRDKEILAVEEKVCGKEQTLFLTAQALAKEHETTSVRVTQMLGQIKALDERKDNGHA